MAKARIEAGNCGFHTDVEAQMGEKYQVTLKIESGCKHIQKLAEDLKPVNALEEISYRCGAATNCHHRD